MDPFENLFCIICSKSNHLEKLFGNLLTYTLLIKTSKYQIFIIHVNILKKLAFKDWLKTSLYVFFDETDAAI